MKKILMYALIVSLAIFSACTDDNNNFNPPSVASPDPASAEFGNSVELSFNYSTDAGFKSSGVSATNGTAVIKTDGTAGSKSGNIVLTFTAGTTVGAGSAVLTVIDREDKTSTATALVSVLEEKLIFNVEGNITSNTTWKSGKVYVLKNRVAVVSGVTLTIEPGVVIKGEAGTGANATALIIARGAKIMAEGTAAQPIIFTSIADEIMPGEVAGPNLDPTLNGLWGGLIVLGNAPISASAASVQIEGIPPSDQNGLYGGSNPNDDSGVIKYISIRHGGANIGEGNEINGLTLGGVGSGTIIENVEVVANQDDGIEWFGGTVNVKNALIWNVGDDAVDTDQAWSGTLDNFIVIAGNDTDHALEIDGPEGAMLAGHTVKNGSIKGNPATELGDFRDGARGTFSNIYFFGFPDPAVNGRGDLSLSGDKTLANFAEGNLVFQNLQVTLPDGVELTGVFKSGTSAYATTVAAGGRTVGADKSAFAGWTWASEAGELTSF
ncbi:MAG: hypothetical protein K0B15_10530 [Lentimicrobium sp.]|nr:hypothetical protein [Lentimicrobium sp.]